MKEERNVRRHRTAGGRWAPVALLLAATLAILSLPFAGRPAYAVDLDQNCSLKVSPGSALLAEDLAQANVEIDLYRVADAIPVPGQDTYDWQMTEPFTEIVIEKDIDNAGWKAAAQTAADIVLGGAPDGAAAWDPSESVSKIPAELVYAGNAADTEITDLSAGLYLIIAHGSDITNYAAPGDAEEGGEASGTVTLASSQTYAYKFSPELISLPTKEEVRDASGAVITPSNTANPGDWIYNVTVTLKPSQEFRSGRLEITKELLTYAQREKTSDGQTREITDPATFIFEVTVYESREAYEAQGKDAPKVHHDYVSIVFDSYGSKTVLVEDLPVDSYAVVEEVYSGKVYTTDTIKTATIPANDAAEVSFVNDYDDEHGGGGSVTNKFSFGTDSGWVLDQVEDDTQDAAVIQHVESK